MRKNELTTAHIILFLVSFLAVSVTATSYVRAYLRQRSAEAQAANGPGGIGGGGRGGFNPQQMAARQLEQMTQQLQLTADQSAKIQAIQERTAPLTQAIFADTTLSRQQRREKMRPLRAESDAQIRQLLTSEQQTKFDAMQAQRRARFGGIGGGGMNGGANGGPNAAPFANPTAPPQPQSSP